MKRFTKLSSAATLGLLTLGTWSLSGAAARAGDGNGYGSQYQAANNNHNAYRNLTSNGNTTVINTSPTAGCNTPVVYPCQVRYSSRTVVNKYPVSNSNMPVLNSNGNANNNSNANNNNGNANASGRASKGVANRH